MVWKRILRDISILFTIVIVIVAIYYGTYDYENNEFRGYFFVEMLVVATVVGFILLQLVWWVKKRRSKSSPARILGVASLRKDDLISENERLLNNEILAFLNKIGAIDVQIFKSIYPRVVFEFPVNHKFYYLNQISLEVISSNEFNLRAVLRVDYPIALSIKRRSIKKEKDDGIKQIPSTEYFVFHSTHSILFEDILVKDELNNLLIEMRESLDYLSINGRFIQGQINSYEDLNEFFTITTIIHDEVILKDFSNVDTEQLECYQCGDVFDTSEDVCNICNAPRPTCIVCLLDLKPSEKKKVVQTPCCGVYAHKEHIISWLRTDGRCPNCKKDQFLWLRKLDNNN